MAGIPDLATYDIDVKGQSPGYIDEPAEKQAQEEGVPGNGLARSAFSYLSPFRAFGTVGDAVGFGHLLAFPMLLVAFLFPHGWPTRLMLLGMGSALLLSFTRSAWIFVALGFLYILVREGKYRVLLGLGIAIVVALMIWTPMGEWYSTSLAVFSGGSSQDYHAEGVAWAVQGRSLAVGQCIWPGHDGQYLRRRPSRERLWCATYLVRRSGHRGDGLVLLVDVSHVTSKPLQ